MLAYLAQIQGMQIAAKNVEFVIDYDPQDCNFRIHMFDNLKKHHCFTFCAEFSKKINKCKMERLINSYNKYEHDYNSSNNR